MANWGKDKEYKIFVAKIKQNIKLTQIKSAITVNRELLKLYWFIGSQIVKKQKTAKWGSGFLKQLSKDLQNEFPGIKGFSYRNIKYIRQWYLFWNRHDIIGQQVVAQMGNLNSTESISKSDYRIKQQVAVRNGIPPIFQIPWGHNLVIISKASIYKKAIFYVNKTIENNWSRAVLVHQIESGLYERQASAITNFDMKLPLPQSDLAKQILKDPYCFDFLTITEEYNEKQLEMALVDNISRFLLELGSGFAYIGKQYHLEIGGKDFYVDLLFYHTKLHCYIVVELKTTEFKPEFAGQLNFYITAIDRKIAMKNDNPTIGLLICKSKNKTIVEYALQGINSPLGVSEYKLTRNLPNQLKSDLPSIEEIEAKLNNKV